MLCRDCYIPMSTVFSFSSDNHEKFHRCPKCFGETKHMRIKDEELDFGELLHKEMNRK